MSGGSLIYLGKHGTIKIDQKGRPRLLQMQSETKGGVLQNYGPVTIRVEGEALDSDTNLLHQKSANQGTL